MHCSRQLLESCVASHVTKKTDVRKSWLLNRISIVLTGTRGPNTCRSHLRPGRDGTFCARFGVLMHTCEVVA